MRVPGFMRTSTGKSTAIYVDEAAAGSESDYMGEHLVERSTSSVALTSRIHTEKSMPRAPARGLIQKRMDVQVEYETERRSFDHESKGDSVNDAR